MRPRAVTSLAAALLALAPMAAVADSVGPVKEAPRPSSPVPSAEEEYNRGLGSRASKDWAGATAAFKKATEIRRRFPEAWNELGYALRNLGRYQESVDAYDEALRQRPNFPEALEYLGEAYVKMGRKDDARKVLERLKPLDAGRAKELAEEIAKAK